MRQQTTRSWGTVPGQRRVARRMNEVKISYTPIPLGKEVSSFGETPGNRHRHGRTGFALLLVNGIGLGGRMVFSFWTFLFLFPLMNSLPMHTSHYAFPRDFLHLDWRELDGDVCLLVGRPGLEGEVVGGLH